MGAPTDHLVCILQCFSAMTMHICMADSSWKTLLVPGKSTPVIFQNGPILAICLGSKCSKLKWLQLQLLFGIGINRYFNVFQCPISWISLLQTVGLQAGQWDHYLWLKPPIESPNISQCSCWTMAAMVKDLEIWWTPVKSPVFTSFLAAPGRHSCTAGGIPASDSVAVGGSGPGGGSGGSAKTGAKPREWMGMGWLFNLVFQFSDSIVLDWIWLDHETPFTSINYV